MQGLAPEELTVLFLGLGTLLGTARLLGEMAQRLHQPAVLGELLAGVLLGPTVFGTIAPQWSQWLFPPTGPGAIALDAIATLSIVLFLLVAGMEVDLSTVWRQGRVALKVGFVGMLVPFALGLLAAWIIPRSLGRQPEADPLIFTLFFATALSISALPVIVKTLMDIDLYRSDLGMVVVSAAILNDLIGWTVFAVVLGLMGHAPGHGHSIPLTIGMTLAFAAAMLTAGRWLIHRALPSLQAYTHWPGGVLGFALTLALLGAALTEWIGIHAIFGSFLVGVAVGDSPHLRERTRVTIDQFVSFIFAPVFFASIGLKVNFISHFDGLLVLTILVIACMGKLAGAAWGARWGGMFGRDAWAVGFAMNARGAMEIILGLLALEAGVIRQRLFVALVLMAIVTSMMSGPLMRVILRHRTPRRLAGCLSPKLFLRQMAARSRLEAIRELAATVSAAAGLEGAAIEAAVWMREEAQPTGIGHGVALPHARIDGLREPLVAAGISEPGIDFDAPDDEPAHLIFLLLTPGEQHAAQLELIAEVARLFRDRRLLDQVLRTTNFTEFLAQIRSGAGE